MNRVLLLLLLSACGEDGATREARRRDASTDAGGAVVRLSIKEAFFVDCLKTGDSCRFLVSWCEEISDDTEAEWCPQVAHLL